MRTENKGLLAMAVLLSSLLVLSKCDYLPVGECLGNCIECASTTPTTCISLLNSSTEIRYPCLPYYTGTNCNATVPGYYVSPSHYRLQNVYSETGPTLLNWSLSSTPLPQTCALKAFNASSNTSSTTSTTFAGLGPFSPTVNASKTLQFSQNIQRVILKISVAVSDMRLSSQTVQLAELPPVESYDAEGNLIIETTEVNTTTSTSRLEFLTFNLFDKNNTLLNTNKSYYQARSLIETTCGFTYQFQFIADLPTPTNLLVMKLSLGSPDSSKVAWNLLSFSAEAGCSGFTVSSSSKCDACLANFYPIYSPDKSMVYGCNSCNYSCLTCNSRSQCTSCDIYSTFDASSMQCTYPSGFVSFLGNSSFNLSRGSAIKANINESFLVKSSSQEMVVTRNMFNNQGYYIKFIIYYTSAFASTTQRVSVFINGNATSSLDITPLDLKASSLVKENNASASDPGKRYYSKTITLDLLNQTMATSTANIDIKAIGGSTDEFLVGRLVLLQFKCNENCLTCSFTSSGLATCSQCKPFFNLQNSCQTCANGFYLANNTDNNSTVLAVGEKYCVKCYSNCLQCSGSTIYSCTQCFSNFYLTGIQLDNNCTLCLYKVNSGLSASTLAQCSNSPSCLTNFPLSALLTDNDCSSCLSGAQADLSSSTSCLNCWTKTSLAKGKCDPTPASGYTLYTSDITNSPPTSSLWTGSQTPLVQACTNDYTTIFGVPGLANATSPTPTSLTYTQSSLPAHVGLNFVLNIFKVGQWRSANQTGNSTAPQLLQITVTASSPGQTPTNLNLSFTNSYGAQICGNLGKEAIFAVNGVLPGHSSTGSFSLTISSPDDGLFVRQLYIYLGACQFCIDQQLSYQVSYIPSYGDNSTQTGLDVWLQFSSPIQVLAGANSQGVNGSALSVSQMQNNVLNSFQFAVNNPQEVSPIKATLLQNGLDTGNFAKYFVPLQYSLVNNSLTVNTTQAGLIEGASSGGAGVTKLLSSGSVSTNIDRYQAINMDDRVSMSQMFDFFTFFNWFTLFTMIVAAFFGVGIFFQEFSIMLQLIFLHNYISTYLLPANMKFPVSALQKMEHLNFFAYPHAQSIESSWFGDMVYPSNFIFQQYNIDVYFGRSFYPIIIINLIYLGWFLILYVLNKCTVCFSESPSKVARFFRNIPQRPLNYFDQIWRYQFLATMWAAMIQFTSFTASNGTQRLDLALCILAFVISILWAVFVMSYTYSQHDGMTVNHFLYQYEDVFYLKTSSLADESKYYLYIGVRFGRLLIYAIFIALFIQQNIIGPIILIFANVLQMVVVYFLNIYRTGPYLAFKMIENTLFIIASILLLIVYGFSNKSSMSQDGYSGLGYGLDIVFILLIINGVVRFLYLAFRKIQDFSYQQFNVGEYGDKQLYNNRNPIPLATTQRI